MLQKKNKVFLSITADNESELHKDSERFAYRFLLGEGGYREYNFCTLNLSKKANYSIIIVFEGFEVRIFIVGISG